MNNLHFEARRSGPGSGRSSRSSIEKCSASTSGSLGSASGRDLPGVAPWTFFVAFQQAFALPTLTAGALPSGAPADGAVAY